MKHEIFLSLVLVKPKFDEASVAKLYQMHSLLVSKFNDFEVLLVDRSDNTDEIPINEVLSRTSSFRYLKLAFHVADDVAIYAGFENAIGDYILVFDPLNNDINLISKLFDQEIVDHDILMGANLKKGQSAYQFGSVINMVSEKPSRRMAMVNLMCLSRKAINAVTESGRLKESLWNRLGKVGLDVCELHCLELTPSVGDFITSLKEVYNSFVFGSLNRFRLLFLFVFLLALVAPFFYLWGYQFNLVIGVLMSIYIAVSSLFMLLIFEFVNKILIDQDEGFDYLILTEKTSPVMVNRQRLNVEMGNE